MIVRGNVTTAILQGPHDYQEDRLVNYAFESGKLFGQLLAVMDGTVGTEVSQHCADRIPVLFRPDNNEDLERPLIALVRQLHEETKAMISASTISVVAIYESHGVAAVAVLGDSPVITVDVHDAVRISPEHNVRTNKEELAAAVERGGSYDGAYLWAPTGNWGLQMSRALGAHHMGDVLNREPETYTVQLGRESIVVVGSDGLLDPFFHGQSEALAREVADIVRGGSTATDLVFWADERGLKDNATAVVWRAQE